MNDDQLLKLLRNPSTQHKGFEQLVGQYSEKLYWQIRRIVFSHDDASDVLQNVFLKVWKNIGTFEGRSHIYTWLSSISINEALDFVRREKNYTNVSVDDNPVTVNSLHADNYFDGNDAEALLQEAIAQLPDVQRTVFTLRYFEEMKYSEMSKILHTTEGGLKASYHLAVKKVREYVEKRL